MNPNPRYLRILPALTLLISALLMAATIAHADLNDGLVAYYPFNGNSNDESGNGNHGIVHEATLTADRFGNVNSAYYFDGISNYISIPWNQRLDVRNFTISVWFNASGFSFPAGTIIDRLWSGSNDEFTIADSITFLMFNDRSLSLYYNYDGQEINELNEYFNIYSSVQLGTWYFLSITKEESIIKYYINGFNLGTIILPQNQNPYQNTANWLIGTQFDNGAIWCPFNGVIDEVRIYNRALSENEIRQLADHQVEVAFKLLFPIKGYNAYKVRVTSVMDHSNPDRQFYRQNGEVLAFNGELGDRKGIPYNGYYSIMGYQNANGTIFLKDILNYNDTYLWYDGHSGYDYGVESESVIAPADGKLYIPQTDPVNGNCNKASPWQGWHTFYIDHENGYSSWYLHCASLEPEIAKVVLPAGTPDYSKYVNVKKGDKVATSGNYAACITVGYHLHFEVRKDGFDHANVIDPYKEDLWKKMDTGSAINLILTD